MTVPYGFRKDARLRPGRGCVIGSARGGPRDPRPGPPVIRMELGVLDSVCVLGLIAVFAVIGLLGKAVEKL